MTRGAEWIGWDWTEWVATQSRVQSQSSPWSSPQSRVRLLHSPKNFVVRCGTLTILSGSCANLWSETNLLVEARTIRTSARSHCRNSSQIKNPSVISSVSPNNCYIFITTVCAYGSLTPQNWTVVEIFFVLMQLCILWIVL